ncbi:MAG TPA: hypothetical protein VEZ40_11575 [Pyrinomonadaceae bacterium]|nr:hypothetical protein [Pyrinomonadaceae bacterium]
MPKRLSATLTISIFCALLSLACGVASNSNTTHATNAGNSNAVEATATNAADPASPEQTSTAGAGDRIGIPECDNYIDKYAACISGKETSPAARTRQEAMLARMRKSWRDQAADPKKNRAELAQACKQATDSARELMKSMGCEF